MQPSRGPSLREALEIWATIAGQSFGGPAAQIALMHRTLVEERKWLGEERFLHALNTCMLLPGPEVHQLLTWVGWLSHGLVGGVLAGLLSILPGFVSLLGMSVIYALFHDVPAFAGALYGLEAAVLAVVLGAMVRIGRRVLNQASTVFVAIAAFLAMFLWEVPFPAVIVAAGLLGAAGSRWFPPPVPPTARPGGAVRPVLDALLDDGHLPHVRPSPVRDLGVAVAVLVAWLAPTAILWAILGPDATFTEVGRFFSASATVTFGGAYAVLGYVGQQAVEVHHWVGPGEMLHGLGLAETTPGPLIQVVQFVGFLATYRDPGPLHPLLAGFLGALLTTWVTFAPSFLFVLAGGPYLERIRRWVVLSSALRAITAAVVGVVASLGLWLTLQVWFGSTTETGWHGVRVLVPDLATVRPLGVVITIGAALGLRMNLQVTLVLMVGAVVGLVGWLVGWLGSG